MNKVIVCFERKHAIGSVCMYPCTQCGDDPENPQRSILTDGTGERVELQPLMIVRESTRDEWSHQDGNVCPAVYPMMYPNGYYYEVRTD